MIGTALRHRARVVRQIEVANITASLEETPSDYFPARLFDPTEPASRSDGSPREAAARSRLVWHREAPAMVAGDRVEVHGIDGTWELLTPPEPQRHGENVGGYAAEVLEIGTLYPITAEVEGAPSAEPVPLSMYTANEEITGHGDYEVSEGEAPVEFFETLDADNRVLVIDEARFTVTACTLDLHAPHCALRLRKVS